MAKRKKSLKYCPLMDVEVTCDGLCKVVKGFKKVRMCDVFVRNFDEVFNGSQLMLAVAMHGFVSGYNMKDAFDSWKTANYVVDDGAVRRYC